jgi:hypothetical protein
MFEIASNTALAGRSMTTLADPLTAVSSLIAQVYRVDRSGSRPHTRQSR